MSRQTSLDACGPGAPDRARSWTDNATGATVTRTNHYADDAGNPVWTNEGGGNWTRPVQAVAGLAAIEHGEEAKKPGKLD